MSPPSKLLPVNSIVENKARASRTHESFDVGPEGVMYYVCLCSKQVLLLSKALRSSSKLLTMLLRVVDSTGYCR